MEMQTDTRPKSSLVIQHTSHKTKSNPGIIMLSLIIIFSEPPIIMLLTHYVKLGERVLIGLQTQEAAATSKKLLLWATSI